MTDTAPDLPLSFEEFRRIDLRVGTVTSARLNPKARVPALVLEVDLGELGRRTSSAQLTANYSAEDLLGKQVVCVVNFEPKRVAGVKSEVLVLGAVDPSMGTVLLGTERDVKPGTRIG